MQYCDHPSHAAYGEADEKVRALVARKPSDLPFAGSHTVQAQYIVDTLNEALTDLNRAIRETNIHFDSGECEALARVP